MEGGECWWLVDPATGWTLRFRWLRNDTWHHHLEVIKGEAIGQKPALLAWRRELPARDERELWRTRCRQGWRPGPAQWLSD